MTVRELQVALAKFPDRAEVIVYAGFAHSSPVYVMLDDVQIGELEIEEEGR